MDKKEMTKKHLATCSVLLVMVIISGFNIYSTTVKKKTEIKPEVLNIPL